MDIEIVESDKKTGTIINRIFLNDVLPEPTLEDKKHERKIMLQQMRDVSYFRRSWIVIKRFFSKFFCCCGSKRREGEEPSKENGSSDASEDLLYAEIKETDCANLPTKKHRLQSLDKITQF